MEDVRVVIDWADPHGGPPLRLQFAAPRAVLQTHALHEVRSLLQSVHAHALEGRWCVGAVSYEAASAFDAALQVHAPETPLAWFAVFDEASTCPAACRLTPRPPAHAFWPAWNDAQDRNRKFTADMADIHARIAAGEFYQINLTTVLQGRLCRGDAEAYFEALRRAQPGGYAAYLHTSQWQLLSVSPELFFDWDNGRLLCRPMKGTAARGATPLDDAQQAERLRMSAKERAENVMIVDLIRNDVSRVAIAHSVHVPRLFHLEPLPSVWQMTSDVAALTRPALGWVDVFAALFPCGSITGAPKVQAMRNLRNLEAGPRGWYCGSIGVVRPGGAARFNVAIRTVHVQGTDLRCGIGSAITSDATAQGEWQEWGHKQRFLQQATEPFELIETLALDDGVLRHATEHWARLARSASHFGWRWGPQEQAALEIQAQAWCLRHPSGLWRVRCRVSADGRIQWDVTQQGPSPRRVLLACASTPLVEADSEWVCHKTTRRSHYEKAFIQAPGVFDTLLYNAAGELTECTRGNIAALIDGRWCTPATHCGLLPGIGRAVALRAGRLHEAVIRLDDLDRVQDWAYLNSLRGWISATVRRV